MIKPSQFRKRFSIVRVLFVTTFVIAVFVAPIAWNKIREDRRKEAVHQNLLQLKDALDKYSKQHPRLSRDETESPSHAPIRDTDND